MKYNVTQYISYNTKITPAVFGKTEQLEQKQIKEKVNKQLICIQL